jgi:hypothetical protein
MVLSQLAHPFAHELINLASLALRKMSTPPQCGYEHKKGGLPAHFAAQTGSNHERYRLWHNELRIPFGLSRLSLAEVYPCETSTLQGLTVSPTTYETISFSWRDHWIRSVARRRDA